MAMHQTRASGASSSGQCAPRLVRSNLVQTIGRSPARGGKKRAVLALPKGRNSAREVDMERQELERADPGGEPGKPSERNGVVAAFSLQQVVEQAPAPSSDKPLKINQDLSLYKLRQKRQKARRVNNPKVRQKLLQEVEDGLLKCMSQDPSDGRPYVSLGKHYATLGRVEDAASVYEEGTKATRGENAYIWQAWATLEYRRKNIRQARKLFDAATVADNQHAAAWHGWGMLEKSEGNFKRARDLFVKGIRYQPPQSPNAFLYQSVGMLAAEQGRPDEARQWFEEACNVGLGKSSPALWQSWGLLEYNQGNLVEAREIFKSGLDKHPRNRFLWLAWADMEAKEGNGDRARRLFEKGHSFNLKDPALLQAWARLEASVGDVDKARKLFGKGAKVDPQHQPLWQAWGIMEWKVNDSEKARELFQKGIWVSPDSKDACKLFQAWGLLEAQEGNVELARSLFKCAVKVDPQSSPAWQAWAQLEERIGNLIRANELRGYSLQSRIEEASNLDLSPTAAIGDSLFVPIVKQLSNWLSAPSDSERNMRLPPRKLDQSPRRSSFRNN